MKKIIALILVLFLSGTCFADTEALSRRIEVLENELQQLRTELQSQRESDDVKEAAGQLSQTEAERLKEMLGDYESDRRSVWSSLDIGIYGYIKLDASYDTSQVSTGNFARWVLPGNEGRDSEFNMTANQTRLGMNITGPEYGAMQTRGNVEIDFYGDSDAENKPQPMVRHAYMELDWPEDQFSIIAGQTWDIISPLNPQTLNYSVLWWAGNTGYRRPQIRLTKGFGDPSDIRMTLAGAVGRNIGRDDFLDRDSGAAGNPSFQGRVGFEMPLFEPGITSFGFSGHTAREEYTVAANDTRKFDSWSANFDITQPINDWITLRCELFTGENLNAYLGGIGQGVNLTAYNEIASSGGWIAASMTPIEKWTFNIGAGMDDVDAADVEDDDPTLNRSVFGNAIYSLSENTSVGLELSHWRTEYKGPGDEDSFRAQASFIYNF